jgi:TPR repeat protein
MSAAGNPHRKTRAAALRAPIALSLVAAALAGAVAAGPLEEAKEAYAHADYATALRLFRLLADSGVAGAQAFVGAMYESGRGAPQDYAEAVKWFRKAADQGLPGAQYALVIMYAKGRGVPEDYVEAHKWFSLAASRYAEANAQDRNGAVRDRELVEGMMTPSQIAEAQKLARDWKPR